DERTTSFSRTPPIFVSPEESYHPGSPQSSPIKDSDIDAHSLRLPIGSRVLIFIFDGHYSCRRFVGPSLLGVLFHDPDHAPRDDPSCESRSKRCFPPFPRS